MLLFVLCYICIKFLGLISGTAKSMAPMVGGLPSAKDRYVVDNLFSVGNESNFSYVWISNEVLVSKFYCSAVTFRSMWIEFLCSK